jgi:hypothetical protein
VTAGGRAEEIMGYAVVILVFGPFFTVPTPLLDLCELVDDEYTL